MTEVDVPDKAQEQRKAEKAASDPGHDKGLSNFGNEREVILAEGLGTQGMEFFDTSFGIELILEDNSLEKDTHAELLEWSSKYEDSEARDTSTFLIMPIVHGPSEATFHPDRPAKLRYFVGNLRELQDEIRGESAGDASITRDAVGKHLREVYEPFISADGEKWRMIPPFDVIFKNHDEATSVWLETRLYHFSEGSIGELVDKTTLNKPTCRVYEDKIPKRLRKTGYEDNVLFGNDTKEVLVFYARKLYEATASDRGGEGAEPVNVTAERHGGMSGQSNGVDGILRYVVQAGEYQTMPMPVDGNWVHPQILYAVIWSEQQPPSNPGIGSPFKRRQFFLRQDRLNKGKMIIVRPQLLSLWENELDLDATLRDVEAFLSK